MGLLPIFSSIYSCLVTVLLVQLALFTVISGQKRSSQGELFSFGEDQPANTRIGTGTLYDALLRVDKLRTQFAGADRRTLRFEVSKSEKMAPFFRVENTSSALYLAEQIDRDDLCRDYQQCCNDDKNCIMNLMISVSLTSSLETEVFTVRVEVQDKDDNAPTFPRESFTVEIREDTAVNSQFALVTARDRDTTANGIATYTLGNETDTFGLVRPNFNNLLLKLLRPLDREVKDRYSFILVAGGRNSQQTGQMRIEVIVRDANDNQPVFQNGSYSATVPEDFPPHEEIIRVEAIDRDEGDYGRVVYDLDLCTEYQQSIFEIDPESGSIYLKTSLDFEKDTNHVLRVQAKDSGSHPVFATETTVNITVTDVNDCAPEILFETAYGNTVEVFEGNERQLPLAIALAHVRDGDRTRATNGNFTCSLNDTSRFRWLNYIDTNNLFRVNLTVPLDRERSKVEYVAVTCVDHGSPSLTSEKVLIINVKDVNDNPPQFSKSSYDVYVTENSREETHVFTLNATDSDESQELSYSIDSNGSRFLTIEEKTGRLFTRRQFDFDRETNQQYSFIAKATDLSGNRRFSATTTINLLIRDLNDNDPCFTQSEYMFVKTEEENGFVGSVRATDVDSFVDPYGRKVEYRIVDSVGNLHAQLFEISQSGEVNVRTPINREVHPMFNLTVLAIDYAEIGEPRRTASARLIIKVTDVNDNPPVISWPSNNNNSMRISYRTPRGTALSRIAVNDADEGSNSRLTFEVISTARRLDDYSNSRESLLENSLITVDEKGTLRVGSELTENNLGNYMVSIRVTDGVHNVTTKLYVTVDDSAAQTYDFESQLHMEEVSYSEVGRSDGMETHVNGAQRPTRQPNGGSNASEQALLHLLITLMLAIAFLSLIIICVVVIIRRMRVEQKNANANAKQRAHARRYRDGRARSRSQARARARDENECEFENGVDKFLAKLLCVAHRGENEETSSSRNCSSEKRNQRDEHELSDGDAEECQRVDDHHEQCDASLNSDLLNNADRTYVTLDSPPIGGNCAARSLQLQRVQLYDEHADKYVDYSNSTAPVLPPIAYCGSQVMCIPYPQCNYAAYLPTELAAVAVEAKSVSPPLKSSDPVYVHKPVALRAGNSAYYPYDDQSSGTEVNNNNNNGQLRHSCSSTNESLKHASEREHVRPMGTTSRAQTLVSCSTARNSPTAASTHTQRNLAAIVKGSYV